MAKKALWLDQILTCVWMEDFPLQIQISETDNFKVLSDDFWLEALYDELDTWVDT